MSAMQLSSRETIAGTLPSRPLRCSNFACRQQKDGEVSLQDVADIFQRREELEVLHGAGKCRDILCILSEYARTMN